MTPKQLAARLHGCEMTSIIPRDLLDDAKKHGLVVVHGASDDLAEFRGAIEDEACVYGGGDIYFDAKGVLPDYDDVDYRDEATMRDYFDRKKLAVKIEAIWHKEGPFAWTYSAPFPCATFDVVEDGRPYCRGIVFALDQLALTPASS